MRDMLRFVVYVRNSVHAIALHARAQQPNRSTPVIVKGTTVASTADVTSLHAR